MTEIVFQLLALWLLREGDRFLFGPDVDRLSLGFGTRRTIRALVAIAKHARKKVQHRFLKNPGVSSDYAMPLQASLR